jgi:hypothetical protein
MRRNLLAGYIVERPMLTPRSSAVFLPRLGIDTKFVVGDKAEDFAKAIDEKTKAIYIERYASISLLAIYSFMLQLVVDKNERHSVDQIL